MNKDFEDQLVGQGVTYTLEMDGKFYIVENVSAKVDEETGEQFFALYGRTSTGNHSEPEKDMSVDSYLYKYSNCLSYAQACQSLAQVL